MPKQFRSLPSVALFLVLISLTVTRIVGAAPVNADDYKDTIRLACIGDSITYGAGIDDRDHNSYPAQLSKILGAKWDVRNFGVNGATLLKQGDNPYYKTDAYKQALDFKPNVIVIKLGTNDSKPQNWQHKADFAADYKDVIAAFKQVDPQVKVYTCFPVPAFPGQWGINDTIIKTEVVPIVTQVAQDTGATVIDLYKALSGKPDLFPDTVHPNRKGAGLIALEVYRSLTGNKEVPATAKPATPTPAAAQ